MLPTKADGRRRPFFPAYMFVRCDLLLVDVGKLQWVPGLRRIVGFAGRPARVPDDAIALIRTKLAEIEAQGGLPAHGFKPGERVVIEGGPLAGLDGIFVGPRGPAERVAFW